MELKIVFSTKAGKLNKFFMDLNDSTAVISDNARDLFPVIDDLDSNDQVFQHVGKGLYFFAAPISSSDLRRLNQSGLLINYHENKQIHSSRMGSRGNGWSLGSLSRHVWREDNRQSGLFIDGMESDKKRGYVVFSDANYFRHLTNG